MLVTFKTLQQDSFTIEIDPSQTVRSLKEKIEAVKGDGYPAKSMKLMYAGKILQDSNPINDYSIEEKKFVIAVVKQPKKVVIKEEVPDYTDDQFLNGSSSNERGRAPRASHEQLVRHIAELGFPRADVEQALCATFNNPDRAVEYLISGECARASRPGRTGIPSLSDENLLLHMSGGLPNPSPLLPSQERIFELFSEAMAECQNHTRAQDQLVEADSERITQSYAQLEAAGITNPLGPLGEGLANLNNTFDHASAYSQTFPNVTEMYDVFTDAFTGGFGGAGLMDHDHEAIERLKQLGFADHRVIEAYFVCERNENAAADYLLSQQSE